MPAGILCKLLHGILAGFFILYFLYHSWTYSIRAYKYKPGFK